MKELTQIPFHDTSRIKNERTRELVRTYQCEAADALDRYFHEGAAVNPRAVGAPYSVETQARVLDILKNVIAKDYLEAKARIVAARAMGATADEVTRFDETPSGQIRETYAYTETDRPIFDRAWSESYVDGFPEKRARKNKEKK